LHPVAKGRRASTSARHRGHSIGPAAIIGKGSAALGLVPGLISPCGGVPSALGDSVVAWLIEPNTHRLFSSRRHSRYMKRARDLGRLALTALVPWFLAAAEKKRAAFAFARRLARFIVPLEKRRAVPAARSRRVWGSGRRLQRSAARRGLADDRVYLHFLCDAGHTRKPQGRQGALAAAGIVIGRRFTRTGLAARRQDSLGAPHELLAALCQRQDVFSAARPQNDGLSSTAPRSATDSVARRPQTGRAEGRCSALLCSALLVCRNH